MLSMFHGIFFLLDDYGIDSKCDLHVVLLKKNLFEKIYAIQKDSVILLKWRIDNNRSYHNNIESYIINLDT